MCTIRLNGTLPWYRLLKENLFKFLWWFKYDLKKRAWWWIAYGSLCTLLQRKTKEKCYQMASEDEKSPKFCQKLPYSCHRLTYRFWKIEFHYEVWHCTLRIIAKKNKGKVLSNGFWKPQSHKKFAKKCHFFATGYYINWQNVIFLKIWAWDYFFLICTLFSI